MTLLGRDALLDRVEALLANHDVVTLTGPGGVGKTSLARVLARRLSGDVLWADVSGGLTGTVLVPLGEGAASSLTNLGGFRGTLVLDEAEASLEDVRPALTAWLERSPGAAALVTSRVPLEVPGECVVRVEGLPPEEGAALLRGALALVLGDRTAALVDDEQVRRAVAAVDGVPLAVELVAAQAGVVPLEEAVTAALAGPQTQALLARSWALLTPGQQALLRVLALVESRFTTADVSAVGGRAEDLRALVRASLVTADTGGGHEVLTLVRSAVLESAPPDDEVRGQHHDLVVARLAADASDESVFNSLADLRSAVRWAVGRPDRAESSLRLAVTCGRTMNGVGQSGIVADWVADLVAGELPDLPPDLLAMALSYAVVGRAWTGPHESMEGLLTRALALVDEVSEPTRAFVRAVEVHVHCEAGRFEAGLAAALPLLAEADDLPTRLLASGYASWCLLGLGRAAEALPYDVISVTAAREDASSARVLAALMHLAVTQSELSDDEALGRTLAEVISLMAPYGRVMRGELLVTLGLLAHRGGETSAAQHLVLDGIGLMRRLHPMHNPYYDRWRAAAAEVVGLGAGLADPAPRDPVTLEEARSLLSRVRDGQLPAERRLERLTARQREVLEAVSGGATSAAAARSLGMSTRTLSKHLENAYTALGVSGRVEALAVLRDG